MIARATMAEIDPVRMSVDDAVELFRDLSLPRSTSSRATKACYVLVSPEGQALVLTFWDSEEAADAGLPGAGASTESRSRSS